MTEVKNTKTGTVANLIETYRKRSNNEKMYVVLTGYGKTHWKASNCELV